MISFLPLFSLLFPLNFPFPSGRARASCASATRAPSIARRRIARLVFLPLFSFFPPPSRLFSPTYVSKSGIPAARFFQTTARRAPRSKVLLPPPPFFPPSSPQLLSLPPFLRILQNIGRMFRVAGDEIVMSNGSTPLPFPPPPSFFFFFHPPLAGGRNESGRVRIQARLRLPPRCSDLLLFFSLSSFLLHALFPLPFLSFATAFEATRICTR